MDVTKSWTDTEMDGQRGPGGYPSVLKIRCKVCSEFRLPVFWHFIGLSSVTEFVAVVNIA